MRRNLLLRPLRRALATAVSISALALQAGLAPAQDGTVDEIDPILPPFPAFENVEMHVENITEPGQELQKVAVTYSASVPIDVSSIDTNDIWVVSRNGYNEVASLVEVVELPSPLDPEENPNTLEPLAADAPIIVPYYAVRATYGFKPGTGDDWDAADNGLYAVILQRGQVRKRDGTTFESDLLGYFGVRVGMERVPVQPVDAQLAVTRLPAISADGTSITQYVAVLKLFYNVAQDVEVTSWGEVVRDGNAFSVDVEAFGNPLPDPVPGDPTLEPVNDELIGVRIFEHRYLLGVLAEGDYKMGASSFGEPIARTEWTVGPPRPEPVFPDEVKIDVHPLPQIAIFPPPPAHYVGDVKLLFLQHQRVEITTWGQVERDGNTLKAEVQAVLVPGPVPVPIPLPGDPDVLVAEPIPPVPQEFEHTYDIGELPAGHYRFLLTSHGRILGVQEFRVEGGGGPVAAFPEETAIDVYPLPRPAIVPQTPGHYVAETKLLFKPGGVFIETWGEVVREGNTFKAEVLAFRDPNILPIVPWPDEQILHHTYDIGELAEGEYRFVLVSRGHILGVEEFKVEDPGGGAPPAEVDLDVATEGPKAIVRARIHFLEPGWVLTDPGEPRQVDEHTFVIKATARRLFTEIDPIDPAGAEGLVVPPDNHPVYHIGPLEGGKYRVIFEMNNHPYARAEFEIGGGGSPPPVIRDIVIHEGDASWAAEVFVVLRPDQTVLDWGEVRRDGNDHFVSIVVGPWPDPGAVPLPAELGGLLLDGVPIDVPLRTESNIYRLGPLESGDYSFSVVHQGERIATEKWTVREPGDTEPPRVEVSVGNIEEPKTEAHRFGVVFHDPSGLDHESIRGATVWVVNRRLGWRAEAAILSYASTDDLPSTGASARYEIEAPGGSWDANDRGKYEIHIEPEKVRDRLGNHLERSLIGGFKVTIWPDPGFPHEAQIDVFQDDASGQWGAKVAIEHPLFTETDDWEFNWGPVHHYGNVIVTLGHYHRAGTPLPPPGEGIDFEALGLLPPEDGGQTISNIYRLGSLRRGRYLFVFLSNLGHFGLERFSVPGEDGSGGGEGLPEITAFEAWQAAAFEPGDWAVLPQMVVAGSNPDGDPFTNFEEYAFGFNPLAREGAAPEVSGELVERDGTQHLGIRYHEMLAADDVVYRIHGSTDLEQWVDVTDLVERVESDARADGVVEVLACLRANLVDSPYQHLKVCAELVSEE